MFETKNAIANGSSEIDMVINIGFLKDGRYEEVEEEIRQIHEACDRRRKDQSSWWNFKF